MLSFFEEYPELANAEFRFGLRAQGHIPTVERMLSEGKSWKEIGEAIGWCASTAREYYEREKHVR